jgi:hypothetical protein
MTITRVYLDIDGVLFHDKVSAWGANVRRKIRLPTGEITVLYAQELLDELSTLATLTEIVWLTTWLDNHSLKILAQEVGLPAGVELPSPQRDGSGRLRTGWKLDALMADQAARPGPFIWVDDEDATDIVGNEPHLIVSPRARLGLTPAEMRSIYEFARAYNTEI